MSQPSAPWMDTTIDPFLPSPEQELYTQAEIEEAFAQHASDQPFLSSTYVDGLQAPSLTYDSGSMLNTDSSGPSTVSTPGFSDYGFGEQWPADALSGASTPYPHPLEQEQTYQVDPQYAAQSRPLPFHARTDSSSALSTRPPPGYARRRSLSHGDLDPVAPAPSHPTFVRLQGFIGSRHIFAAPEDDRRPAHFLRHSRSSSQGPSVLGRPLQHAVPYPMIGTHIGTSIHSPCDKKASKSRKRSKPAHTHDHGGATTPKISGSPILRKMTDPAHLAQSRRIIEIGAMAVRKHSNKLDPRLQDNGNAGLSPHERIMKKLEDIECYLPQDEARNGEALKGCAMIREALIDAAGNMGAGDGAGEKDEDALEAPSKIMGGDEMGLFGGCLDENDLTSLLMRENEQMDGEEDV
ncbi:hypothetical protein IQ06DRAFT_284633 [Phaeosphaeriaceae sp. SRC1lsM3a]|nr:hypothetical protein IQ06DRAFT_284633 [Stagonospora sp. SRC1lsM3a]